jgi:hypothetical protein
VDGAKIRSWRVSAPDDSAVLATSDEPGSETKIVLDRNFEFQVPLTWLLAIPVASGVNAAAKTTTPIATKLRLRFSVWQNRLPVDALPLEGWIELQLLSEDDLTALA